MGGRGKAELSTMRESLTSYLRYASVSDYPGGLNGSTQHELEVYSQESQQLKSFASVDSNGTLPCLILIEYSRTDRFSRRKYCRIN